MEKITKTKKFEMIKDILSTTEREDYQIDILIEFIDSQIESLARKAEKAKEKAAEKKTELDELGQIVYNLLTNEPQTRDQITEQIDGEDITVAKVGARLKKLVDMELAERGEVTATSAAGKKTARKVYTLVLRESVENEE